MKKKYQNPEAEFVGMDLEEMIAFSVTEGVNLDKAPETDETSGNLSRRSVWDEDEDEF